MVIQILVNTTILLAVMVAAWFFYVRVQKVQKDFAWLLGMLQAGLAGIILVQIHRSAASLNSEMSETSTGSIPIILIIMVALLFIRSKNLIEMLEEWNKHRDSDYVDQDFINQQEATYQAEVAGKPQKFCPYCGEKVLDIAVICRYCGKALQSTDVERESPPSWQSRSNPVDITLDMDEPGWANDPGEFLQGDIDRRSFLWFVGILIVLGSIVVYSYISSLKLSK